MPKTVTDQQYNQTIDFIKSNVEPAINSIVDKLNAYLKKQSIHAGVELTWFIDHIPTKEEQNER